MSITAERKPVLAPAIAATALIMALLALAMPVNHDESQYVAAAALAAHARPYADFIYLQTPLQLYLTAPLVGLFPGWLFIALRLVNALMGTVVLGLVYLAQRRLGADARRAAAGAGLLALGYVFQFCFSLVRNDALPALLEALAILAVLEALRRGARAPWLWAAGGACLGAAASAKLSYVMPLAFAGLFVLAQTALRRVSIASLLACGLGAAIGLLPCLLAWRTAPAAFVWDVFGFPTSGPLDWYRSLGQGARLGLVSRLGDGAFHLMVGPGLAVLFAVLASGVAAWRMRVRQGEAWTALAPERMLLWLLTLAGLVAALSPVPMQRQYLLPLLTPLVVLWGPQGEDWRRVDRRLRPAILALMAVGGAIGLGRLAYVFGDAVLLQAKGSGVPAIALTAEAHWIGARLRAARATGFVSTPSPQVVIDSGYPLDPRFAAGPFVYRSGDDLTDADQLRLHAVSPRTLARFLDADPPAAIVTGYESAPRAPPDLDGAFRAYAAARGYRLERSPVGKAELYLRPAAGR